MLLILAPEADAANGARCGNQTGDDAAMAGAWDALTQACPCEPARTAKWRQERSAFVRCARNFAGDAAKSGVIRGRCRNNLVQAAKQSTCARKNKAVTCCKTAKNGNESCSVTKTAGKCKPTNQRFAEVGETESCLDACENVAGPACLTDSECDDGNPCTDDACDPTAGCENVVDPFCQSGGTSGGAGGTSCSGNGSSTHGLSAQELELVTRINNYRKGPNITPCNSLNRAAQDHANDMRNKNYYAHKGKNGSEFWERACKAGYKNGCVPNTWMGEIITGWASTAEAAFKMWKGSPGHNALMKEKLYTVAGIGHACGGPLGHYWVIDFAGANEASCK